MQAVLPVMRKRARRQHRQRQLRHHLLGIAGHRCLLRVQGRPGQAVGCRAGRARGRGHHGLHDVPVRHRGTVHRMAARRHRIRVAAGIQPRAAASDSRAGRRSDPRPDQGRAPSKPTWFRSSSAAPTGSDLKLSSSQPGGLFPARAVNTAAVAGPAAGPGRLEHVFFNLAKASATAICGRSRQVPAGRADAPRVMASRCLRGLRVAGRPAPAARPGYHGANAQPLRGNISWRLRPPQGGRPSVPEEQPHGHRYRPAGLVP
jgi:hypothetical protein